MSRSEHHGKFRMHFQGEDVSQSSLARTPDNLVKEESRRSTRLDRCVPLIVFGEGRVGEPFVERTVPTAGNLQGGGFLSPPALSSGPGARWQAVAWTER